MNRFMNPCPTPNPKSCGEPLPYLKPLRTSFLAGHMVTHYFLLNPMIDLCLMLNPMIDLCPMLNPMIDLCPMPNPRAPVYHFLGRPYSDSLCYAEPHAKPLRTSFLAGPIVKPVGSSSWSGQRTRLVTAPLLRLGGCSSSRSAGLGAAVASACLPPQPMASLRPARMSCTHTHKCTSRGSGCLPQGSGCRVYVKGFRLPARMSCTHTHAHTGRGSGCTSRVSGCLPQGLGCRVYVKGFRLPASGCRVQGAGLKVRCSECQV